MTLHGFLLLMRATTTLVTAVPSPVVPCRNAAQPPTLPGFLVPVYCNDLMFSGHTSTNVLLGMFWTFSDSHVVLKFLVWCMIAFSAFISTLSRDHYTSDVLVAIYLAVLMGLCKSHRLKELFHKRF
eukprot:TRINITY_DN2085_c0_g1_i11.p1 TRINITY_DN2085_c0_g1~~TRINITY_DN2085_c0_g1_i11.p1  ORF type:complete len:126 (-),score=15.26 TRINITY_DN2085_c0_g1_i11:69-446(-)